MAEFQEVMEQLHRLCDFYSDCDDGCPIHEMGCCGNIASHCSDPIRSERIEKVVTLWAAEHPALVYPTWENWLTSLGVQTYNELSNPIPADIAVKLGLKPKEMNA